MLRTQQLPLTHIYLSSGHSRSAHADDVGCYGLPVYRPSSRRIMPKRVAGPQWDVLYLSTRQLAAAPKEARGHGVVVVWLGHMSHQRTCW